MPSTKDAGEALVHLFRFFPPYNVGEGLINLSTSYYEQEILEADASCFDWEVTGRNLFFMLLQAVGFFAAVLLTEWAPLHALLLRVQHCRARHVGSPPAPKTPPDADVVNEQRVVAALQLRQGATVVGPRDARGLGDHGFGWWAMLQRAVHYLDRAFATASMLRQLGVYVEGLEEEEEENGRKNGEEGGNGTFLDEYSLVIRGLVKVYPPTVPGGAVKHAVRGVSLACPVGERFGLLVGLFAP